MLGAIAARWEPADALRLLYGLAMVALSVALLREPKWSGTQLRGRICSGCLGGGEVVVGGDAGEQGVQVVGGELPLERGGDLGVVVLEVEQSLLDLCEIGEVVGGQHLALDDGEVDLD